jgi:PAS domain S-box-containing protein
LERQSRIFDTTLSSITDFAYTFDRAGRFIYANQALLDLWGLKLEDAVGKNFYELRYPDDLAARLQRQIQHVLDTREIVKDETPYTSPTGVGGYYEYIFNPVIAADGTVEVVAGSTRDITARKAAEEKIKQLHERNRGILESITDGFFALDRDWRFTYVNSQAEIILDRMPGDLIGNVLWEVYPGLVGSEFEKAYRRVADEGVVSTLTSYYPDHDRWYEANAYPAPNGITIYFRNVTARMQAEETLRASEEQYRTLFNSIDEGFCAVEMIFDDDGKPRDYRFLELNPAFEELTGLKNAAGKTARELVPDLEDFWIETYGRVALTGEAIRFENNSAPMNRWFDVYASRVGDDASRKVAIVFTNITERKRMLEALSESEARFRKMADHAPVMIWVTEADGTCSYLSQSWHEFTGQTPETGLGFGWVNATHPDDQKSVHETFVAANEKREVFRVEYRLRRNDGEYRWAIDSAQPRFSENGEFMGYIGSVIDITERKQAEQERERLLAREQEARRLADEANCLKDEFLATVSHELRTPLTAIMGWADMLQSGRLDEETAAGALETIARNARAQNQIIADLLDVSRIISGKLRFEQGAVELTPVIKAALDSVRPAAEAKGVALRLALHPTAGLVSGDADRLQQVVWNLLANAVKYTRRGGRVEARLEREDTHVSIVVRDTGEGISAEVLPYIFDRFRQADGSTTRRHGGLGLGLAIVRQLVEAHGGTVRAASHGEGRGATFTVTLPVLPLRMADDGWRSEDAAEQSAIRHPPSNNPQDTLPNSRPAILSGLRVLVVDDEPDARELLTLALTHGGAEVRAAASVAAALETLDRWTPDVLVSDIGMPGEDGYRLIQVVRERAPERGRDIPSLALTGYATAADAARALAAGFQTHLPKPIELAELIATVASLAGQTRIAESE